MGWRSLLAQTVTHRNSEARAFKVSLPYWFPAINATSRKVEGSTAGHAVLIYFQHLALPHGYEYWSYLLCLRERKSGGFHRACDELKLWAAMWMYVCHGQTEVLDMFCPWDALGRLQSSHLCAGEGKVGYKLLLCLCSKTKKFILRVRFNLFFSQKQFQLSLLILLCFHSLIIFANQLWTWARYDA